MTQNDILKKYGVLSGDPNQNSILSKYGVDKKQDDILKKYGAEESNLPLGLKNIKEHPIKSVFTPLAKTLTGKSLEERAFEAAAPTHIEPGSPMDYWGAVLKQASSGAAGAGADIATTPSSYIPLPLGKVLGKIPFKGTTIGKVASKVPVGQIFNRDVATIVKYQDALKNLPSRIAASQAVVPKFKLSSTGKISLDPVGKVTAALKRASTSRKLQEALYTEERGQRIGVVKELGKSLRGKERFIAQKRALKGPLKKADFEPLNVGQDDVNAIFDMVEYSPYITNPWERVAGQEGLLRLTGESGGFIPTSSQLKILKKVFGDEMVNTLLSKRTTLQKLGQTVADVVNVPRALRASFDMSAPLRQGIFLINRPRQWFPAFGKSFKYFGSEKAYVGLIDDIQARPTYGMMQKSKLAITSMGKNLSSREEAFMSDMAERIPFIGRGVRASNRAYSGFLNQLRADTFDSFVSSAQQSGVKITNKFLGDTSKFINSATGRGKLPGIMDDAAVLLNSTFFSPKLIKSRLDLLNPVFYTKLDPFVRKEALKSLVTLGGVVGTVLSLAKANGAEVGSDPRSADFGKVKVGDTRYDVMGGFQQYLRLITQLATGQHVSSTTGVETTVGEGYKPLTRAGIIGRFVESKLAPVPSAGLHLLKGQGYGGEELSAAKEAESLFVPMVWQDLGELSQEHGLAKGIGMLVPGFFGAGVLTYPPTPDDVVRSARSVMRFAKQLYKEGKTKEAEAMMDDNEDIRKLGSKLFGLYDARSKLQKKRDYIRKNIKIKPHKKVNQYNLIDFEIQRIEQAMEKIMQQQKIIAKFNQNK